MSGGSAPLRMTIAKALRPSQELWFGCMVAVFVLPGVWGGAYFAKVSPAQVSK